MEEASKSKLGTSKKDEKLPPPKKEEEEKKKAKEGDDKEKLAEGEEGEDEEIEQEITVLFSHSTHSQLLSLSSSPPPYHLPLFF